MTHPATLLLTRPRAASEQFAEQVLARFGDVKIVISPLLEIVHLPFTDIDTPDGVIFTSRNGVDAWARAGRLTDVACYCVGQATGNAARHIGFDPFVSGGTVEHLLNDLIEQAPSGRLLHIRGEFSRGDLSAHLTKAGINTGEVIAYEQRLLQLSPEAKKLLQGGARVIVPLFSPRTAAHFASSGPYGPQVDKIAISKAAAQTCQGARVAPSPDAEGMMSAIADSLSA